jgi:hypothetical protein
MDERECFLVTTAGSVRYETIAITLPPDPETIFPSHINVANMTSAFSEATPRQSFVIRETKESKPTPRRSGRNMLMASSGIR